MSGVMVSRLTAATVRSEGPKQVHTRPNHTFTRGEVWFLSSLRTLDSCFLCGGEARGVGAVDTRARTKPGRERSWQLPACVQAAGLGVSPTVVTTANCHLTTYGAHRGVAQSLNTSVCCCRPTTPPGMPHALGREVTGEARACKVLDSTLCAQKGRHRGGEGMQDA